MSKENNLKDVGRGAYAALVEMVAALRCDYDRLEELRDERDDYDPEDGDDWTTAKPDDAEELAALEAAAGDCTDQDEARQRIEEDALSVEVRSDWHTPGGDASAAEFCILLTTGGPAVRIVGELRCGEPHSARLEVQDWGTPWTVYWGDWTNGEAPGEFGHNDVDEDVLLAYASCFYFGEG